MKKLCEIAVNARGENSLVRKGPSVIDMSISPWPSKIIFKVSLRQRMVNTARRQAERGIVASTRV